MPIAEEGNTRKVSESYNFVTECFFLAHRAFDLGYRVTVDKLVALNQVSDLFLYECRILCKFF